MLYNTLFLLLGDNQLLHTGHLKLQVHALYSLSIIGTLENLNSCLHFGQIISTFYTTDTKINHLIVLTPPTHEPTGPQALRYVHRSHTGGSTQQYR